MAKARAKTKAKIKAKTASDSPVAGAAQVPEPGYKWMNRSNQWDTRVKPGKHGLRLGDLNVGIYGEIPEQWQDQKNGSARIEQVIYVQRDSHKAMVLGKGGQRVKAIGAAARAELSEILGRPVHLFLFVKVRERWAEDPERYRDIGLDFDV